MKLKLVDIFQYYHCKKEAYQQEKKELNLNIEKCIGF